MILMSYGRRYAILKKKKKNSRIVCDLKMVSFRSPKYFNNNKKSLHQIVDRYRIAIIGHAIIHFFRSKVGRWVKLTLCDNSGLIILYVVFIYVIFHIYLFN